MLSDKKFGLTANLLATKVMPTLIPHTATPGMSLDQVSHKTHCSRSDIQYTGYQFQRVRIPRAPGCNEQFFFSEKTTSDFD